MQSVHQLSHKTPLGIHKELYILTNVVSCEWLPKLLTDDMEDFEQVHVASRQIFKAETEHCPFEHLQEEETDVSEEPELIRD